MDERTVEIAILEALTVSLRTPSEQFERELIVNPKGSYSGLRADKASFKSCRARVESKKERKLLSF